MLTRTTAIFALVLLLVIMPAVAQDTPPTEAPTLSETPLPTLTPTDIPTPIPTFTETPTAVPTATETLSVTFTEPPTLTETLTETPGKTATETATADTTETATLSPTPADTMTETAAVSETASELLSSPTITPSATPTATVSSANRRQVATLLSGNVYYRYASNLTELLASVQEANSNIGTQYVIWLTSALYSITTAPTNVDYLIATSGNIMIVPQSGTAQFTNASGSDFRLFYNFAGTLTLRDIQIDHFGTLTNKGGAVVNEGTLQVFHSIFDHNSGQDGGAIANLSNATIWNSEFNTNTTGGGGGAIANLGSGQVTIQCTRFFDNHAAYGGGISGYEGSSVTVHKSNFSFNVSQQFSPSSQAIYNNPSHTAIDATGNWWAASNGPTAPSGSGSGDSITSNVNYVPYETAELNIYDPTNCPEPSEVAIPAETSPTPTPTPTPTLTPSPTPTPFTSLDFKDNGKDIAYRGVMFWVTYWETISDSSDSGSSADSDLSARYSEFLFQPSYCMTGSNPPSDNPAESYVIGNPITNPHDKWAYFKHCPNDHRFMFARTMLNGFLNYERRGFTPFNYVTANNSSVLKGAANNKLWTFAPCEDQGSDGKTFAKALDNNTAPQWLYGYMNCIGTNSNVNMNDINVKRIRRAYTTTILPQIKSAITNFYDLTAPISDPTTGDPTYGAFSNLDANLRLSDDYGDSYLACVGGCYLSNADKLNGKITYVYRASQAKQTEFSFVKLFGAVNSQNVMDAYNLHIQQVTNQYIPAYSAVLQPVLRREFDRNTGTEIGYLWTTRVYRRTGDMRHFPRTE